MEVGAMWMLVDRWQEVAKDGGRLGTYGGQWPGMISVSASKEVSG